MNQFFGTHYSQEDLQQRVDQRRKRNGAVRAMSMSMVPLPTQGNDDTMDMAGVLAGDTLDDIIMQNNKEIQRRQSQPMSYSDQDTDRRSSSMVEFGASNGNLNGYQFGDPMQQAGSSHMRQQSRDKLDMTSGYQGSGMNMPGSEIGFYSSMQASDALAAETTNSIPGMSTAMMQGMMGYAPMGMEGISEAESANMNLFSSDFSDPFGSGNMEQMASDFIMEGNTQDGLPSHHAGAQDDEIEESIMSAVPGLSISGDNMINSSTNRNMNQEGGYTSPVVANMPSRLPGNDSYHRLRNIPQPPTLETEAASKTADSHPYQHVYSSSGFDMLGALMKVASRKDPEINIGKVDMSCAFVVCDVTQSDCPIVYVSEIFERLTGYTKHEVLGRNCRFLQSPEGKVQSGARREFVDNDSVYYLKERVLSRREAQRSLINYRKGGQPFMNLLTMIPITGEDSDDIKYFVGFQVDLVEKPTSVEARGPGGLYTVDYSQGMLPRYVWQPPEGIRHRPDGGQTISRDDVSTVLSTINTSTESELTKRMWDKVLLENTDDVVHVLSLKGLFLYLSPSSRHVLEYDSSELVGTALSSVCHPSDIVPVTRELKDTSTGAVVSVVFRIRRKKSGYTWFESHGSLCVEQGKGRKCIILVGRERPVYVLARRDIDSAGGIGENEMWTKLSTSGMFLFVSSSVRTLLDRSPDDLVGTSIQALMRSESRVEFGRWLEKARTGKLVTYKHEVLNKRGLVLQAQTTLYPGDASEGQKPTFLVAQTRLLKTSSRAVATAHGYHGHSKSLGSLAKLEPPSDDTTQVSHPSGQASQQEVSTPRSTTSLPGPVTQAGGAGLPIGTQDVALASEENIFDELKTTRCTSWQFELRQMEKSNRLLAEELASLLASKKKRKRRKGAGHLQRDCANCHTSVTPEWRRGPSGQRDLCNSCGLRWAKQTGRVSPRNSNRSADTNSKQSTSPVQSSQLQKEVTIPKSISAALNTNPKLATSSSMGNEINGALTSPGSVETNATAENKPALGASHSSIEDRPNTMMIVDQEATAL